MNSLSGINFIFSKIVGFLLSGQLDRLEVKRVVRKNTNHLDHKHLVCC
jgi:hypothetical protein